MSSNDLARPRTKLHASKRNMNLRAKTSVPGRGTYLKWHADCVDKLCSLLNFINYTSYTFLVLASIQWACFGWNLTDNSQVLLSNLRDQGGLKLFLTLMNHGAWDHSCSSIAICHHSSSGKFCRYGFPQQGVSFLSPRRRTLRSGRPTENLEYCLEPNDGFDLQFVLSWLASLSPKEWLAFRQGLLIHMIQFFYGCRLGWVRR